jgi:NitT/TauT family transport system permease protein
MNQTKYISIFFFIIFWQAIAIAINSSVFPTVIDIFTNMINHIVNGELLYSLYITLYRVFISFMICMIIGISFGILMGLYSKINDILDFLLIIGLNLPALVTIIICYIWFGLSDFAALLAVILNKVPIIIVNIREGARAIERKYFDLAIVYQIPKKEVIRKIYLPQLYPYIMATTRLSLSLIWKIVLFVELLGRSDGVGFQISMFFQSFDIKSILSYSFAFILVVLFIENFILEPLDRRIKRWK